MLVVEKQDFGADALTERIDEVRLTGGARGVVSHRGVVEARNGLLSANHAILGRNICLTCRKDGLRELRVLWDALLLGRLCEV